MSSEKGSPRGEAGQTLIEVIVVVTVSVIVVGALVFATIASLRNASFSKNQAQATKLAQDGLEKVRTIRDRDTTFLGLWARRMSDCVGSICYFIFSPPNSNNLVQSSGSNDFENLGNGLERQVQIKDGVSFDIEKIVTVMVRWRDYSGYHQSLLTTSLRKI